MSENIQASASMNSSYNGNPFHNDLTNKDLLEIDVELSKQNLYFIHLESGFEEITPDVEGDNFFNHELMTFNDLYADDFSRIVQNYRDDRHDDKAEKLLEQGLYSWVRGTEKSKGEWSGKYRPRETIFEWGNMEIKDKQPTPEQYAEMMKEMTEWECSFNTENAKIVPLDFAIHCGETGGSHVHKRDTYAYREEGIWKTANLTKCLQLMGIKTPAETKGIEVDFSDIEDLSKRKKAEKQFQRYNNETAQWDRMRREKWHEILESHGFEVAPPIEPQLDIEETYDIIKSKFRDGADVEIKSKRGKTIQQYKRNKISERARKLSDQQKQNELDRADIKVQQEEIEAIKQDILDKYKEADEAKHEALELRKGAKQQFDRALVSYQIYEQGFSEVENYKSKTAHVIKLSQAHMRDIDKLDLESEFFKYIRKTNPDMFDELTVMHKDYKDELKKYVSVPDVQAPEKTEDDVARQVKQTAEHIKAVNQDYEEMETKKAKLQAEGQLHSIDKKAINKPHKKPESKPMRQVPEIKPHDTSNVIMSPNMK